MRDTLGADQRQQSADYRQLQAEHKELLREHQRVLEERLRELEGEIDCREQLATCQCRVICAEPVAPCPDYCRELLKE